MQSVFFYIFAVLTLLCGVLVVAERAVDLPVHRARVENPSGAEAVVRGPEASRGVVQLSDDLLILSEQGGQAAGHHARLRGNRAALGRRAR